MRVISTVRGAMVLIQDRDQTKPVSEDENSPPSSAEVKNVELYLHSPIRLHGVVLN
jgi:hypothetical protein